MNSRSVLCGFIAAALLSSHAYPQGSGSSRLGQPGPARPAQPAPTYRQPYVAPARPQPTPEEFYQALWRHLVRPDGPYTSWPPLPGKEGLRKGQSPHGAFVRLYANATAQADPKALPPGSILVLEDYSADQKSRAGINILYRVRGYDPRNGDWYWMKYNENGTVMRAAPAAGGQPLAGRVQACIDCHRMAGGNDLVFSNDVTDTRPRLADVRPRLDRRRGPPGLGRAAETLRRRGGPGRL
jgi:hypothetical protein